MRMLLVLPQKRDDIVCTAANDEAPGEDFKSPRPPCKRNFGDLSERVRAVQDQVSELAHRAPDCETDEARLPLAVGAEAFIDQYNEKTPDAGEVSFSDVDPAGRPEPAARKRSDEKEFVAAFRKD